MFTLIYTPEGVAVHTWFPCGLFHIDTYKKKIVFNHRNVHVFKQKTATLLSYKSKVALNHVQPCCRKEIISKAKIEI